MPPDECPIFVLCVGRSGSTLLRLVLDAHDEVACPPETNLGGVFSEIISSFQGLFTERDDVDPEWIGDMCRRVADDTIGRYAAMRGKRIWADKSLSSINHAELLHQVYPAARFVCLYRNCMDTVASLLEACPYGFGAFGMNAYVARFPENLILAGACLWIDKVTDLLAFEERHSALCYRVRYEDLVSDPCQTFERLFRFLKLRWDPSLLEARGALDRDRQRRGLGDYKIWYTKGVVVSSVGRGARLPIDRLPGPVRERMSLIQAALGYDDAPGSDLTIAADANGDWFTSVEELFDRRVSSRLNASPEQSRRDGPEPVAIHLDGRPPAVIDFPAGRVSRSAVDIPCQVFSDADTVLAIANGTCNPGVALAHRKLRFSLPGGDATALTPDGFLATVPEFVDAFIDLVAP